MPCPIMQYADAADWPALQNRLAARDQPADVDAAVSEILTKVADQGDDALVEYCRQFDCAVLSKEQIRMSQADIEAAAAEAPADDMAILREAADNIREYHARQVENSWWMDRPDGTILGQIVRQVDRVGLYIPGGQGGSTPLISSLLMNAIPAQVAGVKDIALVSPPRSDGSLNPFLPAAAHLLGISEIHRVGSAWAVAALAFGTQTIAKVDVIAGPGNVYVTAAKRLVSGKVGIDMPAGPSEIAVVADETADPAYVAADMLSQAEHDPLASSICIAAAPGLAERIVLELDKQTDDLPRNEIARASLRDWGAVVEASSMESAIELVNFIAPEHLELMTKDPWSLLGSIRHAGAIFMGAQTPEPVGDYFAGPNHVLPTNGAARFSSALSVQTFMKKTSLIAASPSFTAEHGAKIARLARLEGLEAHARSVEQRLK